jgi:hypothetical protein
MPPRLKRQSRVKLVGTNKLEKTADRADRPTLGANSCDLGAKSIIIWSTGSYHR